MPDITKDEVDIMLKQVLDDIFAKSLVGRFHEKGGVWRPGKKETWTATDNPYIPMSELERKRWTEGGWIFDEASNMKWTTTHDFERPEPDSVPEIGLELAKCTRCKVWVELTPTMKHRGFVCDDCWSLPERSANDGIN